MKFLFALTLLWCITYQTKAGLTGNAGMTHYWSYPPCCPGGAWYDPKADTTECDDYSGCKWMGQFWAGGSKTYEWVKANDIVSFFDVKDKAGTNFLKNYGNKKIKVTKDGKTFTATILDSCHDNDCSGCCTKNTRGTGYLVDVEYHTAKRRLGSHLNAKTTCQFEIL